MRITAIKPRIALPLLAACSAFTGIAPTITAALPIQGLRPNIVRIMPDDTSYGKWHLGDAAEPA